jgi:hypothetical protein
VRLSPFCGENGLSSRQKRFEIDRPQRFMREGIALNGHTIEIED